MKIDILYLHEEGRFEVWLGASNRKVQAEYIHRLKCKDIGNHKLSQVRLGVDSIIELIMVEKPDFDHPEALREQIDRRVMEFVNNITTMLSE